MSHFSVIVLGPDVERQLAPFHEFECTGFEEYVQDIDELAEAREEFTRAAEPGVTMAAFVEGHYGHRPVVGEAPDLAGAHKYGWMRATAAGDVVELVKRTNPNAKWDWWETGGRWTGFFMLKRGRKGTVGTPGLLTAPADSLAGFADVARKGDIDFGAMRDAHGARAGVRYDKVHALIAGRDVSPWATVYAAHPGDIEAARIVYGAQPVVLELRASEDADLRRVDFGDGLASYLVTREQYVQAARDAAGVPFAIVKDGVWYERGTMGWWGMVADEKDSGQWEREAAALFDGQPASTLFTAVDCHI